MSVSALIRIKKRLDDLQIYINNNLEPTTQIYSAIDKVCTMFPTCATSNDIGNTKLYNNIDRILRPFINHPYESHITSEVRGILEQLTNWVDRFGHTLVEDSNTSEHEGQCSQCTII